MAIKISEQKKKQKLTNFKKNLWFSIQARYPKEPNNCPPCKIWWKFFRKNFFSNKNIFFQKIFEKKFFLKKHFSFFFLHIKFFLLQNLITFWEQLKFFYFFSKMFFFCKKTLFFFTKKVFFWWSRIIAPCKMWRIFRSRGGEKGNYSVLSDN